jgi:hypothetical protein
VFSEKRRLVPKRTKRFQRKYTSESANGEVSEDKDTWRSSSDDGKTKVVPWLARGHQYACAHNSKSMLCR